VAAWGGNEAGQLGDGTTESSDLPQAVSGLSGVTAIAAGSGFSLALLGDGTVMAWGNNRAGELGDGTTDSSDVPVGSSGLSGLGVTAISAGADFSLALLGDGIVAAWGGNERGQLGDGGTEGTGLPVMVSGLSGVTAIS